VAQDSQTGSGKPDSSKHQPKSWLGIHRAATAAEFLDLLSPVSGLFGSTERSGGVIYRGVHDASYLLLPSAFRPTAQMIEMCEPDIFGIRGTNRYQIYQEICTLAAFIKAADRQGHHIPEDSQGFRRQLKSLEVEILTTPTIFNEWPPTSFLSVLALAQHYAVPTRLLDWSLDPYVSAYFAASEAARRHQEPGELAVWAFVSGIIDANEDLLEAASASRGPIRYITAPWATNANARAQRGVFLAHQQVDIDLDQPFLPRPYDEVLVESFSKGLHVPKAIYYLALPRGEAPQLLRYLAIQGYDGSTMFPGLDGAVKSMQESFLWSRGVGDSRTKVSKLAYDRMVGKMEP
jgi:hypothetical protein